MTMISLRLKKEDEKLVKEYVSINNLNLSAFIRETVLEKIEEDMKLDEARILASLDKSKKEKRYSHTEVWNLLEAE